MVAQRASDVTEENRTTKDPPTTRDDLRTATRHRSVEPAQSHKRALLSTGSRRAVTPSQRSPYP